MTQPIRPAEFFVSSRRHGRRRTTAFGRSGISLLEVVLALAIMAVAMAVLGQLIRMGAAAAGYANRMTRAQLVAESIMGEVASGALPAQESAGVVEYDPSWSYEVSVGASVNVGLLPVTVAAYQTNPGTQPVRFSLTRWVRDPAWVTPAQELAEEEAAAEESL